MDGTTEREAYFTLSPREYQSLRDAYVVKLRSPFAGACPPTTYGRVEGISSGLIVAYIWFNPARTEWVAFHPDDATDDVVELFEHGD